MRSEGTDRIVIPAAHTAGLALDQIGPAAKVHTLLDDRSKSRLRWRCRRGLLENDLFIERFFRRHEETLTVDQARGLQLLMDLADNDLLDLLLARREPEGELDCADVRDVLALLRLPA